MKICDIPAARCTLLAVAAAAIARTPPPSPLQRACAADVEERVELRFADGRHEGACAPGVGDGDGDRCAYGSWQTVLDTMPDLNADGRADAILTHLGSSCGDIDVTHKLPLAQCPDGTYARLQDGRFTTLADSRLELGYLIAHQDTARGVLRGEGFELATEGWGNLHAGEGLLLSASLQQRAASTVMDNASVVSQLKGAERSLKRMQQTLGQQQVPGLAELGRTRQLREQIDPQAQGRYTGDVNGQNAMKPGSDGRSPGKQPVERLGRPLLLAEAPHHVAWTTPASAVAYAGQNLQMTVQQDLHVSAGETIATVSGEHVSLFAQSGPLRVIAAQGPVSLQAHDGELELLSEQALTITATDDRIDVLAQTKVALQAGSSAITLEGGNITFSCPGEFKVKAGEHPFMGGESSAPFIPPLPGGLRDIPDWIALDYRDVETQQAMAGTPYEIHFKNGSVIKGELDDQGKAHHEPIQKQEVEKVVYEPRKPDPEDKWPDLELIVSPQQGTGHG